MRLGAGTSGGPFTEGQGRDFHDLVAALLEQRRAVMH
jgi:hypothetical protein